MESFNAVILGLVQGLTEFLPVSSSGHLVLTHDLLGQVGVVGGLVFDSVLHFATALAVAVYFRKDIWQLMQAGFMWMRGKVADERSLRLIIAIGAATVPAVILGLSLEDLMATVFRNPSLVAVTLIVGSGIMWAAERATKNRPLQADDSSVLGWKRAVGVGLFQSLALVPGMSRSGMAISGGMFLGLSRAEAARFAFLIAVPLLLGAGAKQILDLAAEGGFSGSLMPLVIGAFVAFLSGLAVVHFLLKFLRNHSLMVFVWYRLALAGALMLVLFLR